VENFCLANRSLTGHGQGVTVITGYRMKLQTRLMTE